MIKKFKEEEFEFSQNPEHYMESIGLVYNAKLHISHHL